MHTCTFALVRVHVYTAVTAQHTHKHASAIPMHVHVHVYTAVTAHHQLYFHQLILSAFRFPDRFPNVIKTAHRQSPVRGLAGSGGSGSLIAGQAHP